MTPDAASGWPGGGARALIAQAEGAHLYGAPPLSTVNSAGRSMPARRSAASAPSRSTGEYIKSACITGYSIVSWNTCEVAGSRKQAGK